MNTPTFKRHGTRAQSQSSPFKPTKSIRFDGPLHDDGDADFQDDDESDTTTGFEVKPPAETTSTSNFELDAFEVDVDNEDIVDADGAVSLPTQAPNERAFARTTSVIARLRCIVRSVKGGEFDRRELWLASDVAARAVPTDAALHDLVRWVRADGEEGVLLLRIDASDPYNTALREFSRRARTVWTRFARDAKNGGRRVCVAARADLGEPQFRQLTKAEIIDAVFGDRRIATADHEVVRELLGMPR